MAKPGLGNRSWGRPTHQLYPLPMSRPPFDTPDGSIRHKGRLKPVLD